MSHIDNIRRAKGIRNKEVRFIANYWYLKALKETQRGIEKGDTIIGVMLEIKEAIKEAEK